MRRPERIPIILDKLNTDENAKFTILNHWFGVEPGTQLSFNSPFNHIETMLTGWTEYFDIFSQDWQTHPDLRMSQVLVRLSIIPNFPGFWFMEEDDNIMIDCNLIKPRDIKFWGQNYNKNMEKLPETNWILIKDLSRDHIENILLDVLSGKMRVSEEYIEYFSEELKIRQNGKS